MKNNGLLGRWGEVDGQWERSPEFETDPSTHGNPLGLKDLPSPSSATTSHWLGLFAFILLSMSMLATLAIVTIARDKKISLLQMEERRLQESVSGRVGILQTWLDGHYSASKRLTESDVLKLFVADLIAKDLTLPLPRSLRDQRPYFQQLMIDFTKQNKLYRAAILRDDGAILLSSPGPALVNASLLAQLKSRNDEQEVILSPIRRLGDRTGSLVVDALTTFPRPQEETVPGDTPKAFLILTLPIEPILKSVLSKKHAEFESENISLIQQIEGRIDHLSMTAEGIEVRADLLPDNIQPGIPIAFGRRDDDVPVFSFGEPLKSAPWTLYHALDAREALSSVYDFVKVATILALMTVLSLTAGVIALWWRQERNHQRQLVNFYRTYARQADQQRQFLQAITTSMGDWITVSSPQGELVYTNPAFETASRLSSRRLLGRKWRDLVRQPSHTEVPRHELAGSIDGELFDVVELDGQQRIISTNTSDLRTNDGKIQGEITVVRDHTDMVKERQRRLSSLSQTVDAFVHAIELRDPFLLGHTERLRTHALAVGMSLHLSPDDLASLALAASLSQVGKIFIPDDILTKPDRHSPQEAKIMQDHIVHAIKILKRIDFELPIVDVIVQMHERLDGSGYPYGIGGDKICLNARILAAADVFCARTAPRSYRDRLSAGKALYHLASNEHRYDIKVVAALAEFVVHGREMEHLDPIERSFVDAATWQGKHKKTDMIQEQV